jgi:hypothetical protein
VSGRAGRVTSLNHTLAAAIAPRARAFPALALPSGGGPALWPQASRPCPALHGRGTAFLFEQVPCSRLVACVCRPPGTLCGTHGWPAAAGHGPGLRIVYRKRPGVPARPQRLTTTVVCFYLVYSFEGAPAEHRQGFGLSLCFKPTAGGLLECTAMHSAPDNPCIAWVKRPQLPLALCVLSTPLQSTRRWASA